MGKMIRQGFSLIRLKYSVNLCDHLSKRFWSQFPLRFQMQRQQSNYKKNWLPSLSTSFPSFLLFSTILLPFFFSSASALSVFSSSPPSKGDSCLSLINAWHLARREMGEREWGEGRNQREVGGGGGGSDGCGTSVETARSEKGSMD